MTKVISTSASKQAGIEECEKIQQRLSRDFPDLCIDRLDNTSEIFPLLANPEFHIDYVILDLDVTGKNKNIDTFELVHALHTLIKCTVQRVSSGKTAKRTTKIVGLARDDTSLERIKEAISFNDIDFIMAGCSKTYGHDVVADEFKAILEGKADRVSPLIKKRVQASKKKATSDSDIRLTPRQAQILNIINTRGASNKIIARMLNISESTVKLHIGAILKKYGVRNRTQLAIFSKQATNSSAEV